MKWEGADDMNDSGGGDLGNKVERGGALGNCSGREGEGLGEMKRKGAVDLGIHYYFLKLYFTTVVSLWHFSHGNFRLLSPGKASCERVALPNLRCMLVVLVFP